MRVIPPVSFLHRAWLIVCLVTFSGLCQDEAAESAKAQADAPKEEAGFKSKLKGFEEIVAHWDKTEGLFTFYRNPEDHRVFMAIQAQQFDRMIMCSIVREQGDAKDYDSAALLNNFPFELRRVGLRVHLLHKNVYFRADEQKPIHRAVARDFGDSLFASAKIQSQPHPETGDVLVDAAELFIHDFARVSKKVTDAKLDSKDSYFEKIQSFPQNSELQVRLQYNGAKTVIQTLPDRNFSHLYHFSLSAIPESDYKPRRADPRVGHFYVSYEDHSSPLGQSPYVRNIKRWNLRKAQPELAMSPPQKPVVFWLENTIPDEYREAVRQGVLLWNGAFEKIGIKDAIVVEQMPDDADWEAADARYNVIRWIVRPGVAMGVGPSHAHPLTGEIYSADIRITSDWVRSVFKTYTRRVLPSQDNHDHSHCQYGHHAAADAAFAWNALQLRGDAPIPADYIEAFLVDLIAHEVGHTLGLRHNFKGSSVYTHAQIDNPDFTAANGTSSTVMDYIPVNIAKPGAPQGAYFMTVLGPYDHWAIEYAYADAPADSAISEEEWLQGIASRSADPLLAYGSDDDANSSTGLDPRCARFDLSSDPLAYSERRAQVAQEAWKNLERYDAATGEPYNIMRLIFDGAIGHYSGGAAAAVLHIGGMHHNRSNIGDNNEALPFTPVSAVEQRRALEFLDTHIFDAQALSFSPDLLNKLAPPYFGTFYSGAYNRRIDYPVHEVVTKMHNRALDTLFHSIRLSRLQDMQLRYPEGEEPFTLAELFDGVTAPIWRELEKPENIDSYRRPLQRLHAKRMITLLLHPIDTTPDDAQALARLTLVEIHRHITQALNQSRTLNRMTIAHLKEVQVLISNALNAESSHPLK